jgi:hypothetical protein
VLLLTMTNGAIRAPPPSRPSKKQGLFTHLTPRHSRQPEPVETADFQHETDSTDSDCALELPHNNHHNNNNNLTSSMDLLATFGASSAADAPLSPPRSMLDLFRDADTSDPSVLSPREASSDPSSPVSTYQVPASFQLNNHIHHRSNDGGHNLLHHRHSSGSKRSRSVSEKENAHNITTTVAQLFSSSRHNDALVDSHSSDTVPYDWTVNVDQLSPENQTRLYWNLCYGGGGGGGGGGGTTGTMNTFGTNIPNNYSLQDSWSARRLPPPKGWYVTSTSKGSFPALSILVNAIADHLLHSLVSFSQTACRQEPKRNSDSRLLPTTEAARRTRTIPCSRPSPTLALTTRFRLPSPLPATTCTCRESPVLIIGPSSLVHPAQSNSKRTIQREP